jgi:hypothetical protein
MQGCACEDRHSLLPFTTASPGAYARKEDIPPWPEEDPKPEITTLDPCPVKKPKAIALLVGEFEFIRAGYSRVLLRGVSLGTYRRVELWSLWFPPSMSPRPFAVYERFADKTEMVKWNGSEFAPFIPATGEPGTWKWSRVRFGTLETNITGLKAYLKEMEEK